MSEIYERMARLDERLAEMEEELAKATDLNEIYAEAGLHGFDEALAVVLRLIDETIQPAAVSKDSKVTIDDCAFRALDELRDSVRTLRYPGPMRVVPGNKGTT